MTLFLLKFLFQVFSFNQFFSFFLSIFLSRRRASSSFSFLGKKGVRKIFQNKFDFVNLKRKFLFFLKIKNISENMCMALNSFFCFFICFYFYI